MGRITAPAPRPAYAPVALPARARQPVAAAPAAAPAADPRPSWNAAAWQRLRREPGTRARNDAEAAMLADLAASDPQQAMAMAQTEPNLLLRQELQQAVLKGWARTEPAEAMKWVYALSNVSERSESMAALLGSAVEADPQRAIAAARDAFPADPANANRYGAALVDALCDAGDYSLATQFASAESGPDRSSWLGEAYEKWAMLQPQQAAANAAAISDPDSRSAALHGVVGGWEQADPGGLVQFLAQLPPDPDRATMLGQALQGWVKTDAAAASEWINNSAVGPDLDKGVAAVAVMDTVKPDVAVSWAESISDGALRSSTLADVLRNWAQADFAAAQQYFQKTRDLQPDDRQRVAQILSDLQPR